MTTIANDTAATNATEANPYQQFFDAQKEMFQKWQENLKKANPEFNFSEVPGFDASALWKKNMETSQEVLNKVGMSLKAYQPLFELWKKLSEQTDFQDKSSVLEAYKTWSEQSFAVFRETMLPQMPEFMKADAIKCADSMESYSKTAADYMRTMINSDNTLNQAFLEAMNKGPKGLVQYLDTWEKNYDATMGKLMDAPTFGKDMALWTQQKNSIDRFVKYDIAYTKFFASLLNIAQEATEKVLDDYREMYIHGTQPKTFDEFYKYWTKTVSKAYSKAQFTEEMSTLAGRMVDAMSEYKIEQDRLGEMYLANFPVVRKSELDSLYKTVHDLRREVRALRTEMTILKAASGQAK